MVREVHSLIVSHEAAAAAGPCLWNHPLGLILQSSAVAPHRDQHGQDQAQTALATNVLLHCLGATHCKQGARVCYAAIRDRPFVIHHSSYYAFSSLSESGMYAHYCAQSKRFLLPLPEKAAQSFCLEGLHQINQAGSLPTPPAAPFGLRGAVWRGKPPLTRWGMIATPPKQLPLSSPLNALN